MKTFDFSLTNESSGEIEHKINESSFGDGYAQVSAVGINNKSEKWSIVAVGTAEQVRPIINFIDSHKGVKSFYWTPPQGEVGRYLTSAYKLTNIGGSAYRVTANFTQNFGVDSNTQALTNILTINQIGGDEDGNIELSATDLGAEEQGTAQRMMDLLKSEDNPFSQYAKNSDVVKSVNGEMPDADGNVIIDLNGGGSAITDEEIAKIKELAESSAASSESAKSAATDSAQFAKDGQSDALIAANAATSANTAAIDAVNSVERAEKATETANTNLNTAIETFQSLKPVLSVNKVEPDSTYRWNNNGTSNAILSGDKKNLSQDDSEFTAKEGTTIRVAPVIMGRKSGGFVQILVGAALIAASFWTGGAAGAAYLGAAAGTVSTMTAGIGLSLVAGGVSSMLSPKPSKMKGYEQDGNVASYAFGSAVTTTAQGNPVPVLYGERLIGGAVASAGIYAEDKA